MSVSLTQQVFSKGTCDSLTDIINVAGYIAGGLLGFIKVVVPRFNQRYMRVLVNSAVEDWSHIDNEESRTIMLQYAYLGRTIFIFQMIGCYAMGFLFIFARLPFIMAIVMRSDSINSTTSFYNYPISPICWIANDISMYQYVVYFIIQSVQLLTILINSVGSDVYFFSFGMYISGAYEVLYKSLERLNEGDNDAVKMQKLSVFIERHKILLMLTSYFERIYTIIILGVVTINILFTATFGKFLMICFIIFVFVFCTTMLSIFIN